MRVDCLTCGLCSSALWVICVLHGVVLPLLALVLGGVYESACELLPEIILYLFISGVLSITNFIYSITSACCLQKTKCWLHQRCNKKSCFCSLLTLEILLNVIMFAWLITGSVWVYRHHDLITEPNPQCDQTFYRLAFTLVTLQWILFTVQHVVTCTQTYVRSGQEKGVADVPHMNYFIVKQVESSAEEQKCNA